MAFSRSYSGKHGAKLQNILIICKGNADEMADYCKF